MRKAPVHAVFQRIGTSAVLVLGDLRKAALISVGRGPSSGQMHLVTKKHLSSEIQGLAEAAAVLLFSCNLFRFFANLLSSTLSSQGLLHPALCARLQVEGVALHFLNDVFRLNLALEATESVVY